MKYNSKSGIYKASNLTFDPSQMKSYSYDWYELFSRIGQLNVMNDYNYSSTTVKHKYKLRELLRQLGIDIHASIEAPKGLQDLDSSIALYNKRITDLYAAMEKKGSKQKKNEERMAAVVELRKKIKQVENLKKMQKVSV